MAMYIMTRYRTLCDISILTWEITKGNALDCRRDDSKRNDLKPSIPNRDSLEQSDKYPSSRWDGLNGGIPNVEH